MHGIALLCKDSVTLLTSRRLDCMNLLMGMAQLRAKNMFTKLNGFCCPRQILLLFELLFAE